MISLYVIAGQPGAGKSTFAKVLNEQNRDAVYIAQDTIKEFLYDLIGFENLTEKDELIELSRNIFYMCCEYCVKQSKQLIIDYPFSDVQLNFLYKLVEENNLHVKTYVLFGDNKTLYKRITQREDEGRHRGHQADSYPNYDQQGIKQVISFEEYEKKCEERQYPNFKFYDTTKIDTTQVSPEEYIDIINRS